MNRFASRLALALAASLGTTSASAGIVFDYIPATTAGFAGSVWQSQLRGPASNQYDSNVISFFTLGQKTQLTGLDAILSGFSGFDATQYAGIQFYSVNIYTSLIAASSSLSGDVARYDLTPAQATLTNPYSLSITRVVSLPFQALLDPGNYYIGVAMRLDRPPYGQVGLRDTIGPNAGFLVNPAGGFGMIGNREVVGQPGYRLLGDAVALPAASVPEPAAWGLLILGFGLIGGAARRRGSRLFVTA